MMISFEAVLNIVVSDLKAMSEVKSILFFGSVQQGNPTSTSNIDLFVIVEGDETWNYRQIINNIEVEVYFLPHHFCVKCLENGDVTFVRAFSTGTALLDLDGEISKLSELAKRIYDAGPKPLNSLQKNNLRIKLSDSIRDLEGVLLDTPESQMLSSSLVSLSLEAYCQFQNIWAVKHSRLIQCISNHNPQLGQKVTRFYKSSVLDPNQAISIADYVLGSVGGRLLEYQGPRDSI